MSNQPVNLAKIAALAAAIGLLAGCSAQSGTSQTSLAFTAPSASCARWQHMKLPVVDQGRPIVLVAESANLPDGVILSPGVTITNAPGHSGKVEVVAMVCASTSLTRGELINVGDDLAATIAASPWHSIVQNIRVELWVPVNNDSQALTGNSAIAPISASFADTDWANPSNVPADAWK